MRIQRLLDEGLFVATYKFAPLQSLADGPPRQCLDRLSNRLTKILALVHRCGRRPENLVQAALFTTDSFKAGTRSMRSKAARYVASAVISNPYTHVCFRLGDFDAKKLKDGFSFFKGKDLQNLSVGDGSSLMEPPVSIILSLRNPLGGHLRGSVL